jgi:N-acetylglucosaminyldiphosphoundecaprenol N-acetyl-beta-D-mannosaminyltransferase
MLFGLMVHEIDDFDVPDFAAEAGTFGQQRYGFAVTPNVDHLIRYHDDPVFRDYYRAARYILMDSRFASRLVRLFKGPALRVCTGSDLTAILFKKVITPADRILVVGGTPEQAQTLVKEYGLRNLQHYNPPMGFIRDPAAVAACLKFIEDRSPFRFCFLAIGSPQQEAIAYALQQRGRSCGLALCVGASLNFITGTEHRAPLWMQRSGIEWLYRLLQDPRRLGRRYLIRGPRFFAHLFRSEFVQRRRTQSQE